MRSQIAGPACALGRRPAAMPFRIYRQPYNNSGAHTKSVASPLQLPAGAVIDVGSSGTDSRSNVQHLGQHGQQPDLHHVFALGGHPERLSQRLQTLTSGPGQHADLPAGRQGGPGPRTRQPSNMPDNYQDLESLWVVINPQNGLVTVAPVAAGSSAFGQPQHGPRRPTLERDGKMR